MLALAMRPFGARAVLLDTKQRNFVKENRDRDERKNPLPVTFCALRRTSSTRPDCRLTSIQMP